jgi:hypothetical protein
VEGHLAKRRLSQSFLVDLEARDAIVAAGSAAHGETVLSVSVETMLHAPPPLGLICGWAADVYPVKCC